MPDCREIIYQSMSYFLAGIPLKMIPPTTATINCQLSVRIGQGLRYPLYKKILRSPILCKFCVCNHSCCECMRQAVAVSCPGTSFYQPPIPTTHSTRSLALTLLLPLSSAVFSEPGRVSDQCLNWALALHHLSFPVGTLSMLSLCINCPYSYWTLL